MMANKPLREYNVSEGRTFVRRANGEEEDIADFELTLVAKLVSQATPREGFWLAELRTNENDELITKEIVIPSSAFNSTNRLVDHLRSAWCGGTFHFAITQQNLPYYFEQLKTEFDERYRLLKIADTIGLQAKREWVFSQESHVYQGVVAESAARLYHIVDDETKKFSVHFEKITDLRSTMQNVISSAEDGYKGNFNPFMLTMGYIAFSILKDVFADSE